MTQHAPAGRRAFLGAALATSALTRTAHADERDWTGVTPTRYPEPDALYTEAQGAP